MDVEMYLLAKAIHIIALGHFFDTRQMPQ